jgi:hypothetical protein
LGYRGRLIEQQPIVRGGTSNSIAHGTAQIAASGINCDMIAIAKLQSFKPALQAGKFARRKAVIARIQVKRVVRARDDRLMDGLKSAIFGAASG